MYLIYINLYHINLENTVYLRSFSNPLNELTKCKLLSQLHGISKTSAMQSHTDEIKYLRYGGTRGREKGEYTQLA